MSLPKPDLTTLEGQVIEAGYQASLVRLPDGRVFRPATLGEVVERFKSPRDLIELPGREGLWTQVFPWRR